MSRGRKTSGPADLPTGVGRRLARAGSAGAGVLGRFYWRMWSDAILHRFHLRILRHVKRLAEARA